MFNEIRIFYNDETRDCYEDEVLSIFKATNDDIRNKLLRKVCGDTVNLAPIRTEHYFITVEFSTGSHQKSWKPSHQNEWNGFFISYQTYS